MYDNLAPLIEMLCPHYVYSKELHPRVPASFMVAGILVFLEAIPEMLQAISVEVMVQDCSYYRGSDGPRLLLLS